MMIKQLLRYTVPRHIQGGALYRLALTFVMLFAILGVSAQTTINTTVASTGYTGANGAGAGYAITFVIENNSGGAINLTDISNYYATGNTGAVTLYYSTTSLTGAPTYPISAPTWTQVATGTQTATTTGVQPINWTNLNFTIPSGAQYRFALLSASNCAYSGSGVGTCTPNIFTSNNVSLEVGDYTIGGASNYVGYGYTNGPRFFTGSVTFSPAGPCTTPPTAGTTTRSATNICNGTSVNLGLTGNTGGTGQTYQWQSGPSATGPWTNIGTATPSAGLVINPTIDLYYRAIVTCGTQSANSTPIQVTVNSGGTLPYLETFESITANDQLPNCMTATNLGTYTKTYLSPVAGFGQTNHTTGGSKYASYYWLGYATPQAFVTPGFAMTAGTLYEVSFWYVTDGYAGWTNLGAYFGTNNTIGALVNPIGTPISGPNNTTYQQFVARFVAPTTATYFVGIIANYTSQPYYLTIDDISVVALPPCTGTPTAGTAAASPASPCFGSTTLLSLTGSSLNSGLAYQWQELIGSVWTNIVGATSNSYTTPSITSSHTYRATVTCTASAQSSTSTSVVVAPLNAGPPYFENFESITAAGQLPQCMTAEPTGTSGATTAIAPISPTSYPTVINHTPGGSKYGYIYYGSTSAAFITPGMTLVGGKTYRFTFWYATSPGTGNIGLAVKFGSAANIAGLTNLAGTVTPSPGPDGAYKKYTTNITITTTGTYYVGIVSNIPSIYFGPYYTAIDDIGLVELPACSGTPVAGVAYATNYFPCPGDIVTVSDTSTSIASGITLQWQDSLRGGSWRAIPVTPANGANTSDYIAPPANDTTYYRMWVRCANTTSPFDTMVSNVIVIQPKYPVLPYLETFESIISNNRLPNCMTSSTLGTNTLTYTANQSTFNRQNHTTGGSKYASFYPSGTSRFANLFTPGFQFKAGTTYEISFFYRTGNSANNAPGNEWTKLGVYYGTSPDQPSMTNTIGFVRRQPVNNTAYEYYSELFTPSVAGTYYLGIIAEHLANNTNSYLTIDDIGVKELPPCGGTPDAGGAPYVLSPVVCPGGVTDITVDSNTVAFSNVSYEWQSSRSLTGPWTTVPLNATSTLRRYTTDPINDTTYYRVILTCNNIAGPFNVDTSDVAKVSPNFPSIPYLETFEGITAANTLPPCFTASDLGNGVSSFIVGQPGSGRTNHTAGGSKFVTINGNVTGTDAVYTPGLFLLANRTYEFSFWYQSGNTANGITSNFTALDARVGTNPAYTTMTSIGSIRPTPITNNGYTQYIGTYRPTSAGVYYFGISAQRSNTPPGSFLSIDDIGVDLLPECNGKPATGGITTALNATVCPGDIAYLTLAGAPSIGNITITWEQNVGGGWAPVAAPGYGFTTLYLQTAPINAVTRFRAIVACNGSATDTTISTETTITPSFPVFPYLETFESITAADRLPTCMTATNLGSGVRTYISNQATGNRINHTVGGNKMATFDLNTAATNGIFTPGMDLRANRTYKLSFWYITGNSATAGASNVASLSAWYGTEPSIAGMTIPIGTVTGPVNNSSYQQYQETFRPAVSGVYYIGIEAATSFSSAGFLTIDDIGVDTLPACNNPVLAGTITPVVPCVNTPFTLRATGGSSRFNNSGLTFEWQDSTVNGWNLGFGPTATASDYTTSISAPKKFRLIVTCAGTNTKDTSVPYLVDLQPFYNCYCIPTYATGAATSGITKVKLRNLVNSSAIPSPYYTDYTNQQPANLPIPLLTMTVADTVSVTMGSFATNYTGVWIDFNHNSVFEASEFFSSTGSTGANGTAAVRVIPPATTLFGQTRMRIRSGDRAVVTSGMACGATGSAYGEAEDYYVTIQYPPCAGPVTAGAAVSSETSTCPGYSIDLADTTHENRMSGITWDWQSSIDGGLSWDAVAGSANKDTLLDVLFTRPVSYRMRLMCNNTNDSSFSTPVAIGIKPPYACYCVSQSKRTKNDVSDIGAVQIGSMVNNTGGPHILNPLAVRRHTFFTEIPNIVLTAENTYRLSIYHIQRNAVHENARISVFLDYNNDLIYNAAATPNSERVFTGVTTAGDFYIDTVLTLPYALIPNAPTGMRVILNSDLDPNSPANLGCGEYISGETEDYVVKFNRWAQGVSTVSGNIETMSLYPNPTTGKFTVTVTGSKAIGNVDINVTTITGQSILKTTGKDVGIKYSTELDLGSVSRGIYFVEIKTADGEKITRKLSVK